MKTQTRAVYMALSSFFIGAFLVFLHSPSFPLHTKNHSDIETLESIPSLNHFFKINSDLEIHNKALQLLKNNQRPEALLLLEKNFYYNFFLPSFLTLYHLKAPIILSPFLWHISLLLITGLCLLYLLAAFKNSTVSGFKKLVLLFLFYSVFLYSGVFILKNRVSPLQQVDLKSAPFDSAATHASIEKNSHLIVLKKTKDWLRVQTPDKQSGWLKKQDVFQIF